MQLVKGDLGHRICDVSVPRRGSADGATDEADPPGVSIPRFQSPEGEVLTVQHGAVGASGGMKTCFSPPKGKC